MLKRSIAYEAFCWSLGVLSLSSCFVLSSGEGDLFGLLYKRPHPEDRRELYGLLIYPHASALGVSSELIFEVGPDYAPDLSERRALRAALLSSVHWYESIEELLAAVEGPPLGLAVVAPVSSWRRLRGEVLSWFGREPRRRWLLGYELGEARAVEYEPAAAPEFLYKLTPGVVHWVRTLPAGSRANLARMQAARASGESAEGRKPFNAGVYTPGDNLEHDMILERLTRRCSEVDELAAEVFTPEELAAAQPTPKDYKLSALTDAREELNREAFLAEREEHLRENDSNTPSPHCPYKGPGVPEGEKMRPYLVRVK